MEFELSEFTNTKICERFVFFKELGTEHSTFDNV